MANMSARYSDSGNGWDVTINWSCSPGASSAYMTWTVNSNSYERTFQVVLRSNTSQRYNSGSNLSVGSEYLLYVYRNGSYHQQAGPFTITAPYSVSYNANGGSGAPSSQEKVPGTSITLSSSTPTRTGYTFLKWNTNSSGTGTSYSSGGTYSTDSNVTLYAIWQINTWSVTYDANGGTNAPSGQTKTYGTNLTLTSSTPTRTGYTFSKWNTAANGTGTNYSPGGTYSTNAALKLYAIWVINTWPVTYNANGGSNAPDGQTKTYGQTLTLSSSKPTKQGYTFKEWNTNSSGTGTSYSSGGTYSGNAALSLYAIWTANQYTIQFNANGGTGTMSDQVYTYDVTGTLPTNRFTRYGYSFIGWAYSSSGQKVLDDGQQIRNQSYGGTITLYAVWSINSITITFDAASNGGVSSEASRTINYGDALNTLPTASRQYYAFTGWYTAKTGGTKITSGQTFTAATTIYAQFVIDSSVIANIAGVWKKGIPYVNVNGVWKKGYAWVRVNGKWKQGIG